MTAPASRFRLLLAAWPWLAASASGLLLILCYPPFDQGWLAWIALTPLLTALWTTGNGRRGGRAFALGLLTGAIFFTGTFHWIAALGTLFGSKVLLGIPLLLGLYLALYFGFWGWCLGFAFRQAEYRFDSSLHNLGLGALAASAWVAQEWVRGWLFSGFNWNGLGVALRQNLAMIQIADLTGVFGLSGMIAFANAMAVIIVRRILGELGPLFIKRIRWEFSATMLLISAVFAYGVRSLLAPAVGDQTTFKVAVLQPNIPEAVKKFGGPEEEDEILARISRLNESAAALAPDLIVWPESAVPRGVEADLNSHNFVAGETERGDFALLTGSLDYDLSPAQPSEELVFNSAFLYTEHGARYQSYRKIHLVPYGEYLPLRRWMPEPIIDLIPGDLTFGEKTNVLTMPKLKLRLGTLICFEDTLGDLARGFSQAGADLLVNITNDAWFGETPGAEQHLANATLRAVELRRPLLRCTNSGMTCWIDAHGRVDRWLKPFTEGFAARSVSVAKGQPITFYARHGDWCAHLAALVTALAVVRGGLRRRHPSVH